MLTELHARFIGNVQGVGFRYTAQSYALKLGLKGTVRNLADGSVEIIAQGEKEQLDQLLDYLESQAFHGKISEKTVQYHSPDHSFSTFQII